MSDYIYEVDSGVSGVILSSGTSSALFASGIYNDLMLSGSDFGTGYLASWLESHLGEVNTSLQTNFSTNSGLIAPPMNYSEVAIYQEMFTNYYYLRNASKFLGAAGYTIGGNALSIQEADSKISFVNKNDLAKTYRGFAQDSRENLRYLIAQYKMNLALPVQVVGDDFIPGISYWGGGLGLGYYGGYYGGYYQGLYPYFAFSYRGDY